MMKLGLVTFLSLLALGAGCKGDSAKAKPSTSESRTADQGPLVTPRGPGLGPARDGEADRMAARAARERLRRPDGDGDRGPPGWMGGEQLTAEERAARREERQQMREARRQEMLATYDADQDGTLSPEERAAMHQARVAELVDRLDADRDGKLSRQELADLQGRGRFAPPALAALDLDRDGFVTADEMAKAMPPRGLRNRPDWRRGGDDLRGDQAGPVEGTRPDEPTPE
jgi:Ca2+-binding EF-hand superfamily protein